MVGVLVGWVVVIQRTAGAAGAIIGVAGSTAIGTTGALLDSGRLAV